MTFAISSEHKLKHLIHKSISYQKKHFIVRGKKKPEKTEKMVEKITGCPALWVHIVF